MINKKVIVELQLNEETVKEYEEALHQIIVITKETQKAMSLILNKFGMKAKVSVCLETINKKLLFRRFFVK